MLNPTEMETNFNHPATDRLHDDLLRHTAQLKEKKDNLILSETEKTDLAERYSKALSRLWKDTGNNYDAIETLSNCLLELNKTLPAEQKVRPKFSDVIFIANSGAPGNFAYCDMQNVTFINITFCDWEAANLKGATFQNCIFGENTCCSAYNFESVKSVNACTFEMLLSEIDELTDKLEENSQQEISQANMHVIRMKNEDTQKIKNLKGQLRSLQTGHQASSSFRFFSSPEGKALNNESCLAEQSLHGFN